MSPKKAKNHLKTELQFGGDFCSASSKGNRHSRLSSFGTSNFFEKNLCTRTGIFFIPYLGSSGPHLWELLLYSGLCLLHATEHWHLCVIDDLWVRR